MSAIRVPYQREPFRCVCRTCGASEVRDGRQAALDFESDHEAGDVVLSPVRNLGPVEWGGIGR